MKRTWTKGIVTVLVTVVALMIVACAGYTNPTPTLVPRPVATAREANVSATVTVTTQRTTVPIRTAVPTVALTPAIVVIATPVSAITNSATSLFVHPWPVGARITSYPSMDLLMTPPLVDEVVAVVPELRAYIVFARYVPEAYFVPWDYMQSVVAETRGGKFSNEFVRVEWYAPGMTPVVLWEQYQ